jgi:Capsule polysaccharide biosynthesis protein
VTAAASVRPEDLLAARRVLIVDTISWRVHLATSMEIALLARERGAGVRYLNLRSLLPAVEDRTWLPRMLDLSTVRIGRAERLLRAKGIEVAQPAPAPEMLARARRSATEMLRGCGDTAAVCALTHEGFAEIGWGVLSSVVDMTRNPFVSLNTHARLFEQFLQSALLTYELVRAAIRQFGPETVVLFNGRYATTRAVFAAARAEGARALIHDRGRDKDHYWLATEPILDPDYIQRCIVEFWRTDLAPAGEQFFHERRARVEKLWRSYTKRQTVGRIPAAMRDAARWVVFFTSSDDEYVAVGDKYLNRAFPDQIDAVRAVEKALSAFPGHRLCVRIHPNVATKSREQIAFWRKLEVPGGIVVAAEEDFDSYAILERADVVCSYGSTVGIEATYWGKPSLLTGRSIYDRLGATFNATGIEQIRDFVAQPIVFPQLGALMYGAFFARYGTRYRHYQADDLFMGRIFGAYLDPWPVRLLRAAARSLRA